MSTLFGFIVFGKVVVDGRFPDSFNRSLKVFETTTFSLHDLIVTGLPVRPVIKWVFGRRCHEVVFRGRENTRVWYVETMFSQMVS